MTREEQLTKIIKENKGLIWSVVKEIMRKYYGPHKDPIVTPEDLFQTATFGVMSAYDTYDESKGVKFQAYLRLHVSYAVWQEVFDKSKFSQTLMRKIRDFRADIEILEKIYQRHVTSEEIAEFTISTVEKVDDNRILMNIVINWGASLNDDENPIVIRSNDRSVESEVASKEICDKVKSAISDLPQKQQDILKYIYEDDETVADIGRKMGVSRQCVHQARDRIHSKLAKKLKSCSVN